VNRERFAEIIVGREAPARFSSLKNSAPKEEHWRAETMVIERSGQTATEGLLQVFREQINSEYGSPSQAHIDWVPGRPGESRGPFRRRVSLAKCSAMPAPFIAHASCTRHPRVDRSLFPGSSLSRRAGHQTGGKPLNRELGNSCFTQSPRYCESSCREGISTGAR
jgi:hypothetical protein